MGLRLREMTPEAAAAVHRLAQSRTAAARSVERARIVEYAAQGQAVRTVPRNSGSMPRPVRLWLKRFNTDGLAGLDDAPRAGRPATYPPRR